MWIIFQSKKKKGRLRRREGFRAGKTMGQDWLRGGQCPRWAGGPLVNDRGKPLPAFTRPAFSKAPISHKCMPLQFCKHIQANGSPWIIKRLWYTNEKSYGDLYYAIWHARSGNSRRLFQEKGNFFWVSLGNHCWVKGTVGTSSSVPAVWPFQLCFPCLFLSLDPDGRCML